MKFWLRPCHSCCVSTESTEGGCGLCGDSGRGSHWWVKFSEGNGKSLPRSLSTETIGHGSCIVRRYPGRVLVWETAYTQPDWQWTGRTQGSDISEELSTEDRLGKHSGHAQMGRQVSQQCFFLHQLLAFSDHEQEKIEQHSPPTNVSR